MKAVISKIVIFVGFFLSNNLHGVIIGSTTAVSLQPLATFPSSDTDNEMNGFAAFANGFTLQNSATSCLYYSFFPVGGTITLNNGTLNLNLDLALTSDASFVNGGTINGNEFNLSLPPWQQPFSFNGSMIFNRIKVTCNSDIELLGINRFNNSCVLNGQNGVIDCTNGTIVVGTPGSLLIQNATLKGVTAGTFYCADPSGTFSFSNVTILMEGAYSFTQGQIDVVGNLTITGTQIFTYKTAAASTIYQDAIWYFDHGMTFSYAPSIASRNLIAMIDASSVLYLNTTTLASTTTGLQLTNGTLRIDGTCPILSSATTLGQGIKFGNGIAAQDLNIEFLSDSGLSIVAGFVEYANSN